MKLTRGQAMVVTGVGPQSGTTTVVCALLEKLRSLGHHPAGIKPVETGVAYDDRHDLVARDGPRLRAASGQPPPPLPAVSPYRFPTPGPAARAAGKSGISLTVRDLVDAISAAEDQGDLLVVDLEGSPLDSIAEDGDGIDVAAALGAPVFIAAFDTAAAAVTLEEIVDRVKKDGPKLAAVFVFETERSCLRDAQPKLAQVAARLGLEVVGVVPMHPGSFDDRVHELVPWLDQVLGV